MSPKARNSGGARRYSRISVRTRRRTAHQSAPHTFERRSVTLGLDVSGQRRVLSGLRDGERVVLAPPPDLADGQAVKVGEGK